MKDQEILIKFRAAIEVVVEGIRQNKDIPITAIERFLTTVLKSADEQ